MKAFSTAFSLSLLFALGSSQNVTVPTTCQGEYMPGTDTVLYTVPYTYSQVLSIIGSYKNLTWSGSPDNTVTLNGSDNTVGTARTYDLAGAHVIETLLTYDSPPGGPYYENHNVALLTIPLPTGNISVYFPLDATTVTSTCGGKATSFNFTANFCATNATAFAGVLHLLHSTDAITVGKFLGGQNFTSCDALNGPNGTSTGPPMATFTGSAEKTCMSVAVMALSFVAALMAVA